MIDKNGCVLQSAVMHLITMAHLGEAQGVIEKFHLQKVRPDLFKNEEMVLLLTGEGPIEAVTKTALILPLYPFQEVLNLGVAGSLKNHGIGEIYPIRSIYLVQDLKPGFKSFQVFTEGLDCLTSFERILDFEKAAKLRGLGELVDREAWGVAMAAKTAGIPFKAFKIISDVAGTIDACEIIKEKAHEFSEKLSDHLEIYLASINQKIQVAKKTLPGFHFTFSTEHQFKTLLQKLSIKEQRSEEEIIVSLNTQTLREQKLSPKERSRRLLDEMENRLDPLKAKLSQQKLLLQESFKEKGLTIVTDSQWENPKAIISFEAGTNLELQEKIEALKSMSLDSFTKIMNGDFSVE